MRWESLHGGVCVCDVCVCVCVCVDVPVDRFFFAGLQNAKRVKYVFPFKTSLIYNTPGLYLGECSCMCL